MKDLLVLVVWLATLLGATARQGRYNFGPAADKILLGKRRAAFLPEIESWKSPYAITGISRNSSHSVPQRRDIRDYEVADPDGFQLFMLALNQLQSVDQSSQFSWYSLASKWA